MAEPLKRPEVLDAETFLALALDEDLDAELHRGRIVMMAPERAAHAYAKDRARAEIDRAIRAAGAGCQSFMDTLAIRVTERDVVVPDVMLWCGPRVAPRTAMVDDAVLLVEVMSDGSRSRDMVVKLDLYRRLPSFRAYLVVSPEEGRAMLHERREDGAILTRVIAAGDGQRLRLDPPGLDLDAGAMVWAEEEGP